MKNLNVIGATMQICLASGVKAIAVRNIGGVVTDEQRGAKMINRILGRLEAEKSDWNSDYNAPINRAIQIVQEVAKEYEGKTVTISVDIGDLANSVEYGVKSTGKDGR